MRARKPLRQWPGLLAGLGGALLLVGSGHAQPVRSDLPPPILALPPEALAPSGRVTDAAHILTAEQVRSLEIYLRRFQERSRHQMVVVTVPSLNGRDVADYTRDLANRWGVGRKGANDGIVVLVAPNERKTRITIGFGFEKLLTRRYCQYVIDSVMLPKFREGRYYDGIVLGVTGLARVARRI